MPKLNLTYNPKKDQKLTHDEIAANIKFRSMVVDFDKNKMRDVIVNEVRAACKDTGLRGKMLAGQQALDVTPTAPGKYELYLFVMVEKQPTKAAKIDLTIDPPKVVKKDNPLFKDAKGNKINGDGYYGGSIKQPHVHVYGNSAHLKLGDDRYNLVQKGVRYDEAIDNAHDALESHGLKNTLAPWVAAVLKQMG